MHACRSTLEDPTTTWYLAHRGRGDGRVGGRVWAGLAAGYAAALLLKESALVIPGLLAAGELVLRRAPSAPRRRLIPGYALLAAVAAGFLLLRGAVLGDATGTFAAEALEGQDLHGRSLTMLGVVPEWTRLLLWPAALQSDYSPREIDAATRLGGPQLLGLLIVILAAALAWAGRRRAPVLSFGLAWTAIALFPVSNVLVPTGIVLAERTLFLASVGVVLALGGAAARLLSRRSREGQDAASSRAPRSASDASSRAPRRDRVALVGATAILILLGVLRSATRHRVWRSDEALAHAGAVDAPRSYRAQQAYGFALIRAGMPDRGLEAYQRAIALAPTRHTWRVRNDLARRFFAAGRYDLAVDELLHSLRDAPERVETWNYLILGQLGLGNYQEAARLADSALARGASREIFGAHRALADSAIAAKAPPGSIRIRVVPDGER